MIGQRAGLQRVIVLGAIALAPACAPSTPATPDSGPTRDAMVVDSTLVNDAATDALVTTDAPSTSDASLPRCGGSCDPRAPQPCPADMSCRFATSSPACTVRPHPDGGAGADGATCAYDADCADGLACFGAAGLGICGHVCCEHADCASTERCRGDGALVDGTTTAWGRCLPPLACDLAHPDHDCAAREGCYIVDETGATECLPAGAASEGAACGGAADCIPGHVCAGLTARTCVAICLLASTAPHQGCADTQHCEAQAYSPAGTGICTGI